MFPPDDVDSADGLFILKGTVDAFSPAVSVSVEGAGPTVNLGDMTTNPDQRKKLVWLLLAAVVLFALLKKK